MIQRKTTISARDQIQNYNIQNGNKKNLSINQTSNMHHMSNHINYYQSNGLTNFGNTCFINSFIQLLYASKGFRQSIQLYSKQNPKLPQKKVWISSLSNIFCAMTNNSSIQKNNALKNFVKLLQNTQQIGYSKHTQQDSFTYLIKLINKICQQDKFYSSTLELNYYRICQNESNHYKKSKLPNIHKSAIRNQQCKKNIQVQQHTGQYIIKSTFGYCGYKQCLQLKSKDYVIFNGYIPNSIIIYQLVPDSQHILFFTFNETTKSLYLLQYVLKSSILYFGNGNSGHYVAKRKKLNNGKQSQNFFIFNDSYVSQYNGFGYDPKVHLFQFNRKIQIYKNQYITTQLYKNQFIQSAKQKINAFIKNSAQIVSIHLQKQLSLITQICLTN